MVERSWGQLKLYLRPDWHQAGPHVERALAMDPNDALAYAYKALLHATLGNLGISRDAAFRAVAADPLSPLVRALSVMGFPQVGIEGCDATAALAAHQEALSADPASIVNLWMAGVRLGQLGRHEEAVRSHERAVEISARAPLVVGLLGRALMLVGRRDDALRLREELRSRSQREYIGPSAFLMLIGLDRDDEAATAALLQANIDAMTGPIGYQTTVQHEMEALLDHPRLGPLVQQLTLYATRPGMSPAVKSAK